MGEGYKGPLDGWPKKIGAILLGLLGFFAAKALVSGGFDFLTQKSMTPARLETAIAAESDLQPLYSSFKTHYPGEYSAFLERMTGLVRDGSEREILRSEAAKFMRSFMLSKLDSITHAPDSEMTKVTQSQLELIQALKREDVSLCADYGIRGLSPQANLSQPSLAALSIAAGITIEAAHAGETSRVERNVTTLSESDQSAFANKIVALGAPARLLETMDKLPTASQADQCEASIYIYRSTAALPEPQGARVMAFLLIEATKALPPL